MTEGPRIERRDEQPYVSIRTRSTLKEWPRVNALVQDVFRWLEERGIGPAGPPFYRYWTMATTAIPTISRWVGPSTRSPNRYLSDPADEPDPAEWRTELLYQIA